MCRAEPCLVDVVMKNNKNLMTVALWLGFTMLAVACDDSTGGGGANTPQDGGQGQEGSASRLVINEIRAAGEEGEDDFVELTVVGDEPVDLSAFRLVDDNPDHTPGALPASTLSPGEFLVVVASAERFDAGESEVLNFGLGSSDAVFLLRDDVAVDEVAWDEGEAPRGATLGRLPDGTGQWVQTSPTPGEANVALEGEAPPPDVDPFDTTQVVEVRVELEASAWEAIKANPLAEEYHQANIIYNGVRVEQVGIRTKGNSSLNSVVRQGGDRFSFKVDANLYVPGQEVLGAKKLNFNNGFKDPSFMREALGYRLMAEAGLAVPRAAFVDLYVADEHMGLYTVVEAVNSDFLERHFNDDAGDLYKPEPPAGFLTYRGDGIEDYEGIGHTSDEETDHAAFLRFVDVVNRGDAEDFEAVMDVDDVLRYIAANVVLVNLDSLLGFGHNYYLYEEQGRFSIIPWDLNEAFGNFTCGCDVEGVLGFLIDEPTCGALADKPLVAALLGNPELRQTYHNHLRALLEDHFTEEKMGAAVTELATLIRPYVEADPKKFFTTEAFEQAVGEAQGGRGAIPLRAFVARRSAAIFAQLDGVEASTAGGDGNCDGGGGGPGPGPGDGGDHPCGDGVCDMVEQNNPDLCPRDCDDLPDDHDYCGDGNCDARERFDGSCPQDCG